MGNIWFCPFHLLVSCVEKKIQATSKQGRRLRFGMLIALTNIRSTKVLHHASCIMHHRICNMHHASCIMHHASCIMHHASCIMHDPKKTTLKMKMTSKMKTSSKMKTTSNMKKTSN